MMENLGYKGEVTWQPGDIFISSSEAKQLNITLAKGGAYKRGMCVAMKTADKKYYPYDATATDGTQNFDGVLAEDTDTTDGDVATFIYVTGDFDRKFLTAKTADGAPAKGQYKYGNILIKESVNE